MAKVVYDPDLQALTITLPGGAVLKLEGGEPLQFVSTEGIEEERTALFLSEAERTVLGKMIEHVLKTMKITETSREALQAIQTRLATIVSSLIAA